MEQVEKKHLVGKILLPLIDGYPHESALSAAQFITQEKNILLAGFVQLGEDVPLSSGTASSRKIRLLIRSLQKDHQYRYIQRVRVTRDLWNELSALLHERNPDILLLEWPEHFHAMGIEIDEVLGCAPCKVLVISGPIPAPPRDILVCMRGGPNADLSLRIALSIAEKNNSKVTALHIKPTSLDPAKDAPFRGIDRILDQLPLVHRKEVKTDEPISEILESAKKHDLVIIGATQPTPEEDPFQGSISQRLLEEVPTPIVIVKSAAPSPASWESEKPGQRAISVLVDKWFAENTFHAEEFANLDYLVELKQRQEITISLALPALNEEKTVGNVIQTIKSSLMDQKPILDEIVLIDSNSTDRTRQIAEELGIPVYIHQHLLPEYGARTGKGEALWKSLLVTRGDIIVWIDTDIANIHPRFVYGVIGPLLLRSDIQFVKGFYRRPIKIGEKIQAGGGGRVTELTARPLLNLFYPELSGVIQPLSGEYGGRREALEKIPFFSGYGVEIGLLIDVFTAYGLNAIAQVDLLQRIHHNQPLESLSKMALAIIQAVCTKMERRYDMNILDVVNQSMKLIRYEKGRYFLDVEEITEKARPPMQDIRQYRQAFQI